MPEEVTPVKTISWPKVILTILIIVVVAGAIGGGLFWYFYVRQPAETTSVATTKQSTTSAKKATSSAQKDDTANWKTYTDPYGPSFKYPNNWTLKKISDEQSSIKYAIQITSPTDFSLYFTLIGGMGGGCSPSDPRMIDVNVYSIKSAGFNNSKGKAVVIVEEALSGGMFTSKGTNFTRKEITVSESGGWRQIGDNGEKCLSSYSDTLRGAFEVNYNNGTDLYLVNLFFGGSYPDDSKYQGMSNTDYFNLPDVRTAEEILSSVKL